jgi:mono/diheme cytochrome c family protein
MAAVLATTPAGRAQNASFRNAPPSSAAMKNPYQGSATAALEGKKIYAQKCAQCHGNHLQGMGPAPSLDSANIQQAKPGELFWFISTGKLERGMPSWSNLPKEQRWQLVSLLQSSGGKKSQ